ncbi:NUDIX domain-containing protein [Sulfobacillus sp. hq2]|uniref:NUDIX domain-containing protein n=1 Tax=Sulfobacillus sp. hq2 TaxID=2039167 RepID=UPI000D433144|nr:NUDIX hydrolase [Sulfobacillus sp. hq2]POB12209.1 hypothetical protein CO251_00855 [Sulfobacillus sp. hq2]
MSLGFSWPLLDRSCVRPLQIPPYWTVAPSRWSGAPWSLSARQRQAWYGAVWNDPAWFVHAWTPTQLVLEVGSYFDWLATNRLLTRPLPTLPRPMRAWVRAYPWGDVPQAIPHARIALAATGLVHDRLGRWLWVQRPGQTRWHGVGGGLTPDDGATAASPAHAWQREVREELGIAVQITAALGAVASPWADEWVWGFLGQWEGIWEQAPWRTAPDGPLEIGAVQTRRAADPAPALVTPLAAWLWQAVQDREALGAAEGAAVSLFRIE